MFVYNTDRLKSFWKRLQRLNRSHFIAVPQHHSLFSMGKWKEADQSQKTDRGHTIKQSTIIYNQRPDAQNIYRIKPSTLIDLKGCFCIGSQRKPHQYLPSSQCLSSESLASYAQFSSQQFVCFSGEKRHRLLMMILCYFYVWGIQNRIQFLSNAWVI